MMSEALEAPQKIRELLTKEAENFFKIGARLRELDPAFVATIARGSSDHAAAYAKYLIPQCTGRVVASLPPSVVTVLQAPLRLRTAFSLAISQSGSSPDLVAAQKRARESGAFTLALVNHPDSPLARASEQVLPQHAGVERSIAATKTVLCTLAGLARLAAEWAGEAAFLEAFASLPAALEKAGEIGTGLDENRLQGVSHAFVLSRGLGFGAAEELALKLKETSGIHAEAFSTAEVRHGPREIVDKKFLVIALALPGSGGEDVAKAAGELAAQGARVLLVGPAECGAHFVLPPAPDARLSPLLALQMLYPWIARSALALGRNPDQPRVLKSKVVETV
jgi:glutamine---fructose-6-phosphate transaminase (isomerizing)